MLPVAAHMLPVRAGLIPSIGSSVSSAVLEDEAPGNPRIRMAAPFPVARSPDITVARCRSPLFACRRTLNNFYPSPRGLRYGPRTIPYPGDVSVDQLARIFGDVGSLAWK